MVGASDVITAPAKGGLLRDYNTRYGGKMRCARIGGVCPGGELSAPELCAVLGNDERQSNRAGGPRPGREARLDSGADRVEHACDRQDRKSGVEGERVDLGGRRILKKNKKK